MLRSPVAIVNYLGGLYDFGDVRPRYITRRPIDLLGDDKSFISISKDQQDWYVSVVFAGGQYCVPSSSKHTAMLIDILQELRNLNTSPTDLNSAFTVRVSNP